MGSASSFELTEVDAKQTKSIGRQKEHKRPRSAKPIRPTQDNEPKQRPQTAKPSISAEKLFRGAISTRSGSSNKTITNVAALEDSHSRKREGNLSTLAAQECSKKQTQLSSNKVESEMSSEALEHARKDNSVPEEKIPPVGRVIYVQSGDCIFDDGTAGGRDQGDISPNCDADGGNHVSGSGRNEDMLKKAMQEASNLSSGLASSEEENISDIECPTAEDVPVHHQKNVITEELAKLEIEDESHSTSSCKNNLEERNALKISHDDDDDDDDDDEKDVFYPSKFKENPARDHFASAEQRKKEKATRDHDQRDDYSCLRNNDEHGHHDDGNVGESDVEEDEDVDNADDDDDDKDVYYPSKFQENPARDHIASAEQRKKEKNTRVHDQPDSYSCLRNNDDHGHYDDGNGGDDDVEDNEDVDNVDEDDDDDDDDKDVYYPSKFQENPARDHFALAEQRKREKATRDHDQPDGHTSVRNDDDHGHCDNGNVGDNDVEDNEDVDNADDNDDDDDDDKDVCYPSKFQENPVTDDFASAKQRKRETATRNHDQPDRQTSIRNENSSRRTPVPVNPDVMEYIYSTYRDTFQRFLDDKQITFDWESGARVAYIRCNEKESECVEALSCFMGEIKTTDISIEKVYWNCVVAEIKSIQSCFGENPPLIKIRATEMELRIVSCESDAGHHIDCLMRELQKIRKQAAFDCKTFSLTSDYDTKDFILLLKNINFTSKYLQQDCKDVEVLLNEEDGEIRLKGPKYQLNTAMTLFQEQELATQQKLLRLSPKILEFLNTKEGREAIERTFQQKEIDAIVLFNDPSPTEPLSARVLGDAQDAIDSLRQLAVEQEFSVDKNDLRLTTTSEWSQLCEEICFEKGVFIHESPSSNLWVLTGFPDHVENAAKKLQEFVHKNSIEDEMYDCGTSSFGEYIKIHCVEDLHLIATSLEEFDVQFKSVDDRMLHMSGRRKGLEKAKTCLDELINHLVLRHVEGRQPGLRKYFEEGGRGERWASTVQHRHKCMVEVDQYLENEQDSSCSFVTSQGHSISCKIGDIASERAHTVVCPQGECSEAISYSSGLQFPEVEIGELTVLQGLDLPCSCVLFTRCSNWNGGDGEQCLRELVQKSLRKVDALKGTSVAFPAIGTGKLQFPPRETARIMVDETVKFCRENLTTTVTNVRFIVLPQNKTAIDAFCKEINCHQKKPVQNEVPLRNEGSGYDSVRIFTGDLTRESQTDAILNIISTNMTMKAGSLSEAVFRAAGKDVEEEFNSKVRRYDFPEAVMTSGGKLNVPHIIHIIPNSGNKQSIMQSLEKGLLLAKQNNIRSLSLPAIGTGWYGLSPSDSASIIFEALSNVWISSQRLSAEVHIVLFKQQFLRPFQQEKQKYISRNIQTEIWCEKVEIVQGDLTMEKQTEAILNVIASDMNMKKPGYLSAAVVRAAGCAVEEEFQTKTRQLKNPEAVMTSAGMLSVSHIIHIIPTSANRQAIKASLETGLLLAKQSNIRSISLPAVGTGWYNLSYLESANMIFQAVSNVWGSYTSFSKVRIVLLQNDAVPAFRQVKRKYTAVRTIQSGSKRSIKMQHMDVEVVHGDLTNEASDAIVNIINPDMDLENAGEVSKAIARVCGESPKKECRQLGTQQPGSVVITSGGNLKARHIIHIIPTSSDPKHLQICLEKSLEYADEQEFCTLSLPAIGTGGYGLPPIISANLIFGALTRSSKQCTHLKKIRLVVKEQPMVNDFRQEQKKYEESRPAKVSTRPTNHTLRITLTGKDEESVDMAFEDLRKDFSETWIADEIKDDVVEDFTSGEINMLIAEAENVDVELTVEITMGSVTLSGNKDDVILMNRKIHKTLNQAREREKKRLERENAQVISNSIQWCYAVDTGRNIPFEASANLEIERAYNRGDQTVGVLSDGVKFDIDCQQKTGFKQPENHPIAVQRNLKGTEAISLPEYWDQMPSDSQEVHTVLLDRNSPEYQKVSEQFYATAQGPVTISDIQRIQNPWLYQSYTLLKEKMEKNNGFSNERLLFHATKFKNVKSINCDGFKRNLTVAHGTYYGQGVYFARDASKSQNYTDDPPGQRYMYLVRVLVGKYCPGNRDMKTPPFLNGISGKRYDSAVDLPVNPREFVIFYDTQCYPEHLIRF